MRAAVVVVVVVVVAKGRVVVAPVVFWSMAVVDECAVCTKGEPLVDPGDMWGTCRDCKGRNKFGGVWSVWQQFQVSILSGR